MIGWKLQRGTMCDRDHILSNGHSVIITHLSGAVCVRHQNNFATEVRLRYPRRERITCRTLCDADVARSWLRDVIGQICRVLRDGISRNPL